MKRKTKTLLQAYLNTQRIEYRKLVRKGHIIKARRLRRYIAKQMELGGVRHAA